LGQCGEYLIDSDADEADGANEVIAGTPFSSDCKEGAADGQEDRAEQSGLVCDLCGQVLKQRGRMKLHRDSNTCQRAQKKRRKAEEKAEDRPPAEMEETAGTPGFSCEHCRATWESKAALDGHRTHCKAPPKEKELNGATEPLDAAAEESSAEQPGGLVALGAEQGGREAGREEGGEGVR